MNTTVLGVDACKHGWIGVRLADGRVDAFFAPTIRGLADRAQARSPLAVMAVDIPIGLPDSGVRQADVLARRFVGRKRGSSVFPTPIRGTVVEDDYQRALLISRESSEGRGISTQAHALRRKIREVDAWLPAAGIRVVEIHPEVCFAAMAGEPLPYAKKTWAGQELRRDLLARAGITLPSDLGEAGREAAPDDMLDAAAAAWTASRVLAGTARSLPDPPEVFGDGIASAIWY